MAQMAQQQYMPQGQPQQNYNPYNVAPNQGYHPQQPSYPQGQYSPPPQQPNYGRPYAQQGYPQQ